MKIFGYEVALNWKLALFAGVVVALLVFFGLYSNRLAGFQNPAPDINTFTMYYADWCPHCKTAKPEMEALVAKGTMDINGKKCVVRMIQPEQQPEEAKGKPIKGFPTFLLETTDGETVEYKGQRNTAGYLSFLNETLGSK
jgi:thiol-disulfide isomerase/thioredoxin